MPVSKEEQDRSLNPYPLDDDLESVGFTKHELAKKLWALSNEKKIDQIKLKGFTPQWREKLGKGYKIVISTSQETLLERALPDTRLQLDTVMFVVKVKGLLPAKTIDLKGDLVSDLVKDVILNDVMGKNKGKLPSDGTHDFEEDV